MVHRSRAALLALLFATACGGGTSRPAPSSPTTPTTPTTPTPPTNTWSAAGRITALGGSTGIGGATIAPDWGLAPVTTDGQGNYELGAVANPPLTPYGVSIAANGFLTRDAFITWARGPRTGVDLNLIRNSAPFSLEFYQQFLRGMYDQKDDPGAPYANFRWTSAPSFYVRTIDSVGRNVEPEVIAVTVDALRRAVPAYTAGTYQAAAIDTGTAERPETTGWINVNFVRNTGGNTCGTSFIGRNPGVITLYLDICSCGSNKVPGSVTMHEVGHAMGFFHVGDRNSLMFPFNDGGCRAGTLSAAETYHAGVAYSRPRGNRDPDRDPTSSAALAGTMLGGGPLVK